MPLIAWVSEVEVCNFTILQGDNLIEFLLIDFFVSYDNDCRSPGNKLRKNCGNIRRAVVPERTPEGTDRGV